MSNLKNIVKKMKAVSADEDLNKKTMIALMKESDCFGTMFEEDNKFCQDCNILMEYDGHRKQLSVFCQQFTQQHLQQSIQQSIPEKEEVKKEEPREEVKEKVKSNNKKSSKEEEDMSAKKRYTKEEIGKIVGLKKEGKSFEEIQTAIKDQFGVERNVRSLKIIYERNDESVIRSKKRYSKDELAMIMSLKKEGKSFEEIQTAIKDKFKVERPIRSLEIVFDRESK